MSMLTSLLGCDGPHAQTGATSPLDAMDVAQWKLPKPLHEISGLAAAPDGRLFAHDDERGIVYVIDPREGRITSAFALGDPPVRGDFEGIAVAGTDLYLMTSDGLLYRTRVGTDGGHVDYERTDTGLGTECELEGLAFDASRSVLLASCKAARNPALAGRVTVFAWSIVRHARDESATISIDERALAEPIGARAFNPSSVEIGSDGSTLWLLAGRQRALARVDFEGRVLAVERLPSRHRQPEGLTFASDGSLVIADEGGDGHATLSVYRPR